MEKSAIGGLWVCIYMNINTDWFSLIIFYLNTLISIKTIFYLIYLTIFIYIGAIMYEMLVGYPPFYSENPVETCSKV